MQTFLCYDKTRFQSKKIPESSFYEDKKVHHVITFIISNPSVTTAGKFEPKYNYGKEHHISPDKGDVKGRNRIATRQDHYWRGNKIYKLGESDEPSKDYCKKTNPLRKRQSPRKEGVVIEEQADIPFRPAELLDMVVL
ncbi:MAG: hypothetical protein HW406_168 [Candidatus Brocadiaceae bacterium]|nr:hypothetical protein [Candidatus Brocadiaceae bacterium]